MYMLHSLRDKLDLNVIVFEAGDGVGGTWYWNRYCRTVRTALGSSPSCDCDFDRSYLCAVPNVCSGSTASF